MKTCGYCGRENDDAAVHCKECGTEIVEAPPPSAPKEPKERKPWPDLGLRYAGYTLIVVILYFLSFGPVTYFFGKVTSGIRTLGLTTTYAVTVQYPRWVAVLYYPAFGLEATPWGNQIYSPYMNWWRKRQEARAGS